MAISGSVTDDIRSVDKLIEALGGYDYVKNLWKQYRAPSVVFAGYTGAGKTQIYKKLQGDNQKIARSARTRIATTDTKKINGEFAKLIDLPGEDLKVSERIRIFETLRKKKNVGLVYVVSNGYVEPDIPWSESVFYDENDKTWHPKDQYISSSREKELNALFGLIEILKASDVIPIWSLVLINKADLWWGPDDALNQLIVGAYENEFLHLFKGELNIDSITVLPCSARIQLFFDKAPTSGFYGEDLKNDQYVEVMRSMYELAFKAAVKRGSRALR